MASEDESVPAEPAPQSLFDQLEQRVWSLPDRNDQYGAFIGMLEEHIVGVCRPMIITEELFLLCAACHSRDFVGERMAIAFRCLQGLFDALDRRQLQTCRQAFEFVRDAVVGEMTTESLDPHQARFLLEYITDNILKEFALFDAVFAGPMQFDTVNIQTYLPTPVVPTATPLNQADEFIAIVEPSPTSSPPEIEPCDDVGQQQPRSSTTPLEDSGKEAIIARMVDAELNRAKDEMARTIARHRAALERQASI